MASSGRRRSFKQPKSPDVSRTKFRQNKTVMSVHEDEEHKFIRGVKDTNNLSSSQQLYLTEYPEGLRPMSEGHPLALATLLEYNPQLSRRSASSYSPLPPILVAQEALEISIRKMFKNTCWLPSTNLSGIINNTNRIFYEVHRRMLDSTHMLSQDNRVRVTERLFGMEFDFFKELCVLTIKGIKYNYSWNCFLALLNLANSRWSAHTFSLASEQLREKSYRFSQDVCTYYSSAADDFRKFGNRAFAILRVTRALVIGSTIETCDPIFEDTLSDKVIIKETRHSKLHDWARRPLFSDVEISQRLEIVGLDKSFSGVVVNMKASAESHMKRVTDQSFPLNEEVPLSILHTFRMQYIRSYFNQHGRWPQLKEVGEVRDDLSRSIRQNEWYERDGDRWTSDLFRNIQLAKNHEFDYKVDVGELMKDAAILSSRNNWSREFVTAAFNDRDGRAPKRGKYSPGKLVIEHLTNPDPLEIQEILRLISINKIPKEWLAGSYVGKEGELKEDELRAYLKNTLPIRLYQVVTESNLSETIMKLMKFQSMTMGNNDQEEALQDMSETLKGKFQDGRASVSLDFSKWCTSMTYQSTLPLFMEIDRLFGLGGVYSKSHLIPLQTLYVFKDSFNPPEVGKDGLPIEGDHAAIGATRWAEGMRQKGWTIFTGCLILNVIEKMHLEGRLLGQGDNQTVLFKFQPGIDMVSRIDGFLEELKKRATDVGLIIKPSESWRSSIMMEYSKQLYYKGRLIPTSMKKISSCLSENSSGFGTISAWIGGIFSAGTSAASTDEETAAYFTSCAVAASVIESVYTTSLPLVDYLQRHCLNYLPRPFITALCLLPRAVGFLPIIPMDAFFVRAGYDPLASTISLLSSCSPPKTPVEKALLRMAKLKSSHRIDTKLVVQNPYSLPLDFPQQPENYLRQILTEEVPKIIQNPQLKELVSRENMEQVERIYKDVSTMDPLAPKVANKIVELSAAQQQESSFHKFNKSDSIVKTVVAKDDEDNIIGEMATREMNVLLFYLWKYLDTPDVNLSQCLLDLPDDVTSTAAKAAVEIRETMWKRKIVGVRVTPPEEQVSITPWAWTHAPDGEEFCGDRSFLLEVDPKHGGYKGSETTLRRKKSPLMVMEDTPIIRQLKELVSLNAWLLPGEEDKNLKKLLRILIEEKTSIPIEELARVVSTIIGGSIEHRLKIVSENASARPNRNLADVTGVQMQTDGARQFAKSHFDYTIFWQLILCYCQAIVIQAKAKAGLYRVYFRKDGGTEEVHTDDVDLSEEPTYTGMKLHPKWIVHNLSYYGEDFVGDVVVVDHQEAYESYTAVKVAKEMKKWWSTGVSKPVIFNLTELSRVEPHRFLQTIKTYLLIIMRGGKKVLRDLPHAPREKNPLLSLGTNMKKALLLDYRCRGLPSLDDRDIYQWITETLMRGRSRNLEFLPQGFVSEALECRSLPHCQPEGDASKGIRQVVRRYPIMSIPDLLYPTRGVMPPQIASFHEKSVILPDVILLINDLMKKKGWRTVNIHGDRRGSVSLFIEATDVFTVPYPGEVPFSFEYETPSYIHLANMETHPGKKCVWFELKKPPPAELGVYLEEDMELHEEENFLCYKRGLPSTKRVVSLSNMFFFNKSQKDLTIKRSKKDPLISREYSDWAVSLCYQPGTHQYATVKGENQVPGFDSRREIEASDLERKLMEFTKGSGGNRRLGDSNDDDKLSARIRELIVKYYRLLETCDVDLPERIYAVYSRRMKSLCFSEAGSRRGLLIYVDAPVDSHYRSEVWHSWRREKRYPFGSVSDCRVRDMLLS